jgi:hypothetical protein
MHGKESDMHRNRVPPVGAAFAPLLLAAAGARAIPTTVLVTENWEPEQWWRC